MVAKAISEATDNKAIAVKNSTRIPFSDQKSK